MTADEFVEVLEAGHNAVRGKDSPELAAALWAMVQAARQVARRRFEEES